MLDGIIIWYFLYLTGTGIFAPGILPPQCHGILINGSTWPYDVMSIAGTFQRFCSQRRNISQCVVDNEDQMVTSDNPESWAIGLVFQKSAFDSKSNAICKRLADVASELECILYETGDVPCGSGFSELIPNIYSLYKANNITEEKARNLICRAINSTAYCYKTGLKPCIKAVKDFMAGYNLVFSGQCTSEFREKLYKSAIFSCAIETFPNIISNVMETDLTTQEIDNRKITSSTEILRVYANHVLHFCTNAEKFIECVHETVPVSNNTMDRILIELMDFSRKDNLVQITANVCREILGDIKSNINCIIPEDQTCTGIPNFPRCFNRANHTLRSAFEDTILSTDINGNAVRATFCKPVEEMMSCATENIKSCNPSVALHVNDFMKILLITDCKEKVKNSASNYKLKNVWTTVFIAMMLLLIVIHPV